VLYCVFVVVFVVVLCLSGETERERKDAENMSWVLQENKRDFCRMEFMMIQVNLFCLFVCLFLLNTTTKNNKNQIKKQKQNTNKQTNKQTNTNKQTKTNTNKTK